MKTFTFVARSSNSGKTTVIEKVVPLLKAAGLRVAVVKHAPGGFEIDRPGKDSWRYREAGAEMVLLIAPGRIALMSEVEGDVMPENVRQLLSGADVILQEGFKHDGPNRIEVFRSSISGERPLCLDDRSFIALVSDLPFDIPIPCFDLNDAAGIAKLVLKGLNEPDQPAPGKL